MTQDSLIDQLASVVGDRHVLSDPDLRAPYEQDFTGRYGAACRVVVRPASAAEVSDVLRLCAEHGADVVPQGGNTGVVGGGVPRGGEVLVSTSRLTEIGTVDDATGHLLVGAGATLANVQAAALAAGWEMPLDLGARDGASIGGLVATDAGGAKALAYGTMRQRVAGLSMVLPDGRIVERLGGLLKDNAGYHWPSLMVGSEGTLGIITAVLVRLVPRPAARVSALFAVGSVGAAMELLATFRRSVPSLEAADIFFDEGVDLVERELTDVRLPLKLRSPCYVVVDCAGMTDPTPELAQAVERLEDLIVDQAAADGVTGRHAMWHVREALPDAVVRAGVPIKIDVAVPLARVEQFIEGVRTVIVGASSESEVVLWGHLGDGNVHVNVLGAERNADLVEEQVLQYAATLGGTVSAEHGVGISKARYLPLVRSVAELELLRALKAAVDPAGSMNPDVILRRASGRVDAQPAAPVCP